MKGWVVFKAKDIKAKKKQFIIDSIYTTLSGAHVRQARLHGYKDAFGLLSDIIHNHHFPSLKTIQLPRKYKSKKQETYIINIGIKGLLPNV